MLARLNATADRWLQARGIRSEPSRRALRALAALAALSLAAGLALIRLTPQILCLGVGMALALFNLFCLSRTVSRVVARPTQASLRFQAGVLVFLRITATVALLLLILWHMPRAAFGLLAGFAVGMAVLTLSGLVRPDDRPDSQTDGQAGGQTERQTAGQADGQAGRRSKSL